MPEPTQLPLNPGVPPQAGFSRVIRTTRSTSAGGVGGRPGGRGWRHFAATNRRCQDNSVPGVTIRCARSCFGNNRASAAITALSLHVGFGGPACRRSTVVSCHSTNISTSFDAGDRANSTNQDKTVTKHR